MTRDMCFLGRRTHIARISVLKVGEHILIGIRVSRWGNTYH